MANHFTIKSINPSNEELIKIGFDSSYSSVGVNKHLFKSFKICNLSSTQANILKQTALSVGTDCAVHKFVITNTVSTSDCILSGSIAQLHKIVQKLRKQPFGLKQLADDISDYLQSHLQSLQVRNTVFTFDQPLLMGILNVTPDSFSDGGCYLSVEDALTQYNKIVSEGADIVDIGGESTRPGSLPVASDVEIARLLPVVQKIREADSNTVISIDTRNSNTARTLLNAGVDVINDVSGMEYDSKMVDVILEYNCPIILGHSGFEESLNDSFDCVDSLFDYFSGKIDYLLNLNFDKSKIIIDPCLGFGKSSQENIEIIKRINELKSLGCPLLIGHSRKRFLKEISAKSNNNSLDEITAFVSQYLIINNVDIIRVHNIEKHSNLLSVYRLFS